MADTVPFSLDLETGPTDRNITDIVALDSGQVVVRITGLEADDTVDEAIFTAKVALTDSDLAARTIQKTITATPSSAGAIESVGLNTTTRVLRFALTDFDTSLLLTERSYNVQVRITRGGTAYARTVLSGAISSERGPTTVVLDTFIGALSPTEAVAAAVSGCQTMSGLVAPTEPTIAAVSGTQKMSGVDAVSAPAIVVVSSLQYLENRLSNVVAAGNASLITGKNDGDAMSSWVNLTGSGIDAAQATGGQQPLYKTGVANGMPAVKFDGSNDTLLFSGTGLTWFNGVAGLTLLAVVQARVVPSGTAPRILHVSSGSSTNAARGCLDSGRDASGVAGGNQWNAGMRPLDATGTTPVDILGATVTTAVTILAAVCDFANNLVSLYVNGQLSASAPLTVGNAAAASATNSLAVQIGAATGASALLPWDGWIFAYALCNAALSRTTQFDALLHAWGQQYNVTILPP